MITFGYFSSYNLNQPPYNDVDLGDCFGSLPAMKCYMVSRWWRITVVLPTFETSMSRQQNLSSELMEGLCEPNTLYSNYSAHYSFPFLCLLHNFCCCKYVSSLDVRSHCFKLHFVGCVDIFPFFPCFGGPMVDTDSSERISIFFYLENIQQQRKYYNGHNGRTKEK